MILNISSYLILLIDSIDFFFFKAMMENSNQVRTLCLSRQLHIICKGMLNIDHERLCHWVCLCLSVIWEGN